MMTAYENFLGAKRHCSNSGGFDPLWTPDFLFDFQKMLVEWAIRRGRAALFADCGMGKGVMALAWAQNIILQTDRPVLFLTPIAVGAQIIREAAKFDIPAFRSRGHEIPHDPMVVVTNYEKLHHFDREQFAGVVCDESGILKNFNGKTRDAVIDFLRPIQYRLLCTATAAPNDFVELGNSAEALGEMGFQDMVSKFFKKETSKDHLGWGRMKYRMRGHAQNDFWRWVCSWGRAIRKPSDLGCDDGPFILPPLVTRETTIRASRPREGLLFDMPAVTLEEQAEERRRTIPERCAKAAELVAAHDGPSVAWCYLNDEGDELARVIPDAEQIAGATPDNRKEELLEEFAAGNIPTLISKPEMTGWGLNWQHCCHQTFFPSHSFEQYYQAVRRSWRFGQKKTVTVDLITSEGEQGVLASLGRKAAQADQLFAQMAALMNDPNIILADQSYNHQEVIPSWL